MATIEERREVRVTGADSDFVFVVEPEQGRLVIRQEGEDDGETIAKARERNANAFRSWSNDEEQRLLAGHRDGRSVADLARELGRSQRAVTMRLRKLGVDVAS